MLNNKYNPLADMCEQYINQYEWYMDSVRGVFHRHFVALGVNVRDHEHDPTDDETLAHLLEQTDALGSTELERYLAEDDNRKIFDRVKSCLKVSRGTRATLKKTKSSPDFGPMTIDRQYDLALLRIIAGGLILYLAPERCNCDQTFGWDAPTDGHGKQQKILPSKKVQLATRKALIQINEQGLELGGISHALELLSNGFLPPLPDVSMKTIRAFKPLDDLVREMTALSREYLDITSNTQKTIVRFSTQAIANILDLVGHPSHSVEATIKAIRRIQKTAETEKLNPRSSEILFRNTPYKDDAIRKERLRGLLGYLEAGTKDGKTLT